MTPTSQCDGLTNGELGACLYLIDRQVPVVPVTQFLDIEQILDLEMAATTLALAQPLKHSSQIQHSIKTL